LPRKGTGYPAEFNAACAERLRQRLRNAGGLVDFGVNLMRLPPGFWSSRRHWHSDTVTAEELRTNPKERLIPIG
jgi:uncharacterized cupin superfamily protein